MPKLGGFDRKGFEEDYFCGFNVSSVRLGFVWNDYMTKGSLSFVSTNLVHATREA